jgi:UDP-arabinose 4-epimerase
MRILVTGGAGYIGSHTAKLLAAAGHEPVIFDDLSQGHEWAVQWGPLERGSLSDPKRLAEVFAGRKMDAVVHFAANALVGESMANPAKYFQNNTVGSLNLLNAMREAGVGTIVFSSTCATYGNPVRVPIDETHPQSPVNPYGESKLMVEKILRWYGDSYGLRWMALRYFNAAGADPDGEIGEDHDPESHLIPLVIGAAQGIRPPVKIFGIDYPTLDGTAVRDYVHVMDLADAHLRAIECLRSGTASQAINLGTGRGHSVKEVVDTVARVGGRPVPTIESPRRPGDPPELVAAPIRARDVLGWTCRYPDVETIVRHAWAWHEKHRPPTGPRDSG